MPRIAHMTVRRSAALVFLITSLIVAFVTYRTVGVAGPALSTDNAVLVPGREAYLYVAKAAGGKPTLIITGAKLPFDAEDPAWSPDGTSIAFTGIGCGGCEPSIYVLELRDGEVRRLTSGSHPAWSRRGWIAFVRRGIDGVDRIFLMTPRGQDIHALYPNASNGSQPSWSPDGRKIAFVRLVGDAQHGSPQIFTAHTDGTRTVDLANDPVALEITPAWSPDGKHVAFSNFGFDQHWDIYVMRADGSGKQKLASLAGNTSAPSWSPDGKQLVVMSDAKRRSGFPSLYVLKADGHGLRRLTQAPSEDLGPAWSPNGAQIAFSRRPLVWIVDQQSTRANQYGGRPH